MALTLVVYGCKQRRKLVIRRRLTLASSYCVGLMREASSVCRSSAFASSLLCVMRRKPLQFLRRQTHRA